MEEPNTGNVQYEERATKHLLCCCDTIAELILIQYGVATVIFQLSRPGDGEGTTIVNGDQSLFYNNKALCENIFKRNDLLQVEDQLENPTLRSTQLLSQSKLRFILAYPVFTAEGKKTGMVCLLDTKPRHFTKAQLTFLTKSLSLSGQIILFSNA